MEQGFSDRLAFKAGHGRRTATGGPALAPLRALAYAPGRVTTII